MSQSSLVPNSNIVGLARLKIVAAPYCVCRYIYRQWQWECRLVQMESAPALPKISAYCHLGPVVVDRASSIGCAPPSPPRRASPMSLCPLYRLMPRPTPQLPQQCSTLYYSSIISPQSNALAGMYNMYRHLCHICRPRDGRSGRVSRPHLSR